MHHDELAFEFDGMVKFVGLEVARRTARPDRRPPPRLSGRPSSSFNDQLEEIAQRNGCERVLVDTSRAMSELFIDYLNQRNMLVRGTADCSRLGRRLSSSALAAITLAAV